jgi:protein-S-isoprenylcysteine O-methyltransferase Ste14
MQDSNSLGVRAAQLAYGTLCYLLFLGTFLYAIGFVGNAWGAFGWHAPFFRSMDVGGASATLGAALLVDALLLTLFAVQHSGMAREGFKSWWTRVIPKPIERSTFVLATCLCLGLLFWQWRPIGTASVWNLTETPWEPLLITLSAVGWLIVLSATFLINHFELFGLQQVWQAFRGIASGEPKFATPALYRAVRHPLYLGFIVAFWATPLMTLSHLVFAIATSGYILIAIQLEERDLVRRYGDAYLEYRSRVPKLLPIGRRRRAADQRESGSAG